jgi:hypothetical protein
VAAARGHRSGSRVTDRALLHVSKLDGETSRRRHVGGACTPFLCACELVSIFYTLEINGRHTRKRVNYPGFR